MVSELLPQPELPTGPPSDDGPALDPNEVLGNLVDAVLFTDAEGIVRHATADTLERMGASILGSPFWDVLRMGVRSLDEALRTFPPGRPHEDVPDAEDPDAPTRCIRLVRMPETFAPDGGLVIISTNSAPLHDLSEAIQERLDDNIAAWGDTIRLFTALFETSWDATLMADDALRILAANPAATKLLGVQERTLAGDDLRGYLEFPLNDGTGDGGAGQETWDATTQDADPLALALAATKADPRWKGKMYARTDSGATKPVEATLLRVEMSESHLYQVTLRDLSEQNRLEKGLKQRTAEVTGMTMALERVLKHMEREKEEVKEELVQQVREELLPAVERLAESPTPEQRLRYKRAIHTRIEHIAGDSSDPLAALSLQLSPREMDICRLVLQGFTGREIAENLQIAFETLQTHRKNIRRKLGLRGRRVSLGSFLAGRTDTENS